MSTVIATVERTPICPPAPRTLAEAGLSHELVLQLLLKHLHFSADLTGQDLSQRLGLEFTVIETVLETLRFTHLCEVASGSVVGGPSFRYRITDEGRRRALLFLEQSHYVGPAPVPLQHYREYLLAHGKAVTRPLSRARVREAFSHLVLSSKVLDQVGPAVAAGHSMFVYGPPGNGKTVIAQAIRNLLDGDISVPHAIEVEGQIIRVFDPVSHEQIPDAAPLSGLLRASAPDGRWVRCRRPMVMVGGELTLESLDLTYSPQMGFYGAPVQMKANGGVLVIDDFGRQRVAARDLLNRWIVPLESRIDFLTLETGQKFDLPFQVMVIFATNVKPAELVDEAFLRRIHYKVFAENPTRQEFMQIFEDCCHAKGLAFDATIAEALLARLRSCNIRFRGCHPRDLINQALSHAEYLGEPRELTPELMEAACAAYFVDDTERE